MLHKFFEPGMWFRPKAIGYGAGLPIAWQGWVLMVAHIGLILGVSALLMGKPILMVPLVMFVAIAPMPIYAARTAGGWKWRWGGKG